MRLPRLLPRDDEELEREAGIMRSASPQPTRADIAKLERKRLGPLWGKKRNKMSGWPRS